MPNSYGFHRKAEDVEVRFYCVVNAHSERNDINTEQLIFVSLKIKKKRKKGTKKISVHPESIAVLLNGRGAQYH